MGSSQPEGSILPSRAMPSLEQETQQLDDATILGSNCEIPSRTRVRG